MSAATLLLSACTSSGFTSSSDMTISSIDMPGSWEGTSPQNTVLATSISAEHLGWLRKFEDPGLLNLVAQAYEKNPNLERLKARLEKAGAFSKKAKAGLRPVVTGNLIGTRTENIDGDINASASFSSALDVSWDPDLWGRLASASSANNLRTEAASADLLAGRHILAASIAETYFLAIEAQRLAQVSQNNLDALNKTLGFVTVQYERGLRSGQDISLIRTDVASARVSHDSALGAARDAIRALEILMGGYPANDRLLKTSLPNVPKIDAIGQPAEILTRRPDLRAARYRVEAAYAAHKSSRAAQRPNLSLSGEIGGNDSVLGRLFDPQALAGTLLANLAAPIFDGGARKADVLAAKADIDEALANYQELTLDAFREAERQIDQGQILERQEFELNKALSDARDALRFTQFRYESGDSDLLNVLSVQQRVSFIEGQLVSIRRARLVQYVNLALALGIEPMEI